MRDQLQNGYSVIIKSDIRDNMKFDDNKELDIWINEEFPEVAYEYIHVNKSGIDITLVKSKYNLISDFKIDLERIHDPDSKRIVFLSKDSNGLNVFTGKKHDIDLFAGESETNFDAMNWINGWITPH